MRDSLRGQGFEAQSAALAPGKAVQMKGGQAAPDVHAAAAKGTASGGGAMPHLGALQASFGRHDLGGVQAHVGGAARDASQAMGAEAYATGNRIAFAKSPDLHTAAHEAAHVIQQQQGVSLTQGVGKAGDAYEKQADQVADRVVQGQSAEELLDRPGSADSGSTQGAIQKKGTQLTDVDLPALGFPDTTIDELTTGLGGDTELKTYVDALGGTSKLKELVLTHQLTSVELQQHGGAAFYKAFVGCGASTISHVTKLDGIAAGVIKGCHDQDVFLGEVLKKVDFTVQDVDPVTKAPMFDPIPQEALDDHQKAQKKYKGQLDFYNGPNNMDKNGDKRLKAPPTAPVAPAQPPKMVTKNLDRGRIINQTPLSVPGVTNMDYELRRTDNAEWRNASNTKTTIKDLASNSAHWSSICNEAIWNAIRSGTFGTNWSGTTNGGAVITGYWKTGAAEVDTFFFTT